MNKSSLWHTINGVEISYAFRQSVIKFAGTQTDPARVFFRAEHSGAKNPIAWIRAGLKAPDYYALKACAEEYEPRQFQQWKDKVWDKLKGPVKLSDILKGV